MGAGEGGLVIFERVPGKGHPGAKSLFVGAQRSVLRVQFVAKTVVQREIGPDLPRILPVCRGPRPRVIRVDRIAETLLENLGKAKGGRLQGIDAGASELRANQKSRQRTKNKPAGEKSMRFRMVAAKY